MYILNALYNMYIFPAMSFKYISSIVCTYIYASILYLLHTPSAWTDNIHYEAYLDFV